MHGLVQNIYDLISGSSDVEAALEMSIIWKESLCLPYGYDTDRIIFSNPKTLVIEYNESIVVDVPGCHINA